MQSLREGHGDATCKLNKSKVDGKIIIVSKARFPDPESRRVLVDDKVGNKSRSYDSGNNVRNEVRVQSVLDSSSPLGSSLWGITFSAEPRKRPEQSHAFSRENVSGYEHENVLTINNEISRIVLTHESEPEGCGPEPNLFLQGISSDCFVHALDDLIINDSLFIGQYTWSCGAGF
ncbi:hypothetical protein V6N13_033950 [Hibiscus sabdariffa]